MKRKTLYQLLNVANIILTYSAFNKNKVHTRKRKKTCTLYNWLAETTSNWVTSKHYCTKKISHTYYSALVYNTTAQNASLLSVNFIIFLPYAKPLIGYIYVCSFLRLHIIRHNNRIYCACVGLCVLCFVRSCHVASKFS